MPRADAEVVVKVMGAGVWDRQVVRVVLQICALSANPGRGRGRAVAHACEEAGWSMAAGSRAVRAVQPALPHSARLEACAYRSGLCHWDSQHASPGWSGRHPH